MSDAITLRIGGDSAGAVKATRDVQTQLEHLSTSAGRVGQTTNAAMQHASTAVEGFAQRQRGALATLSSSLQGISIGAAAMGVGIAAAASAAYQLAAKVSAAGAQIAIMSDRAGMSTTGFQRLSYAAAQSGVDVGKVASAAQHLGEKLAVGDRGAVAALAALGLRFEAIRDLTPENQITTISEALRKVSDAGAQSAASVALFGDAGRDVLPVLRRDLTALGDEAERLGAVLDEGTIVAMQDFERKMTAAQAAGEGLTARAMIPLLEVLNQITGAALDANVNLGDMTETMVRVALDGGPFSPGAVTAGFEAESAKLDRIIEAQLERMRRKLAGAGLKLPPITGPAFKDAEQAVKDLEAAQKKAEAAAKKHAEAVAQLTGAAKVTALREMGAAILSAGGASKILASEYERVNKVFTDGILAAEHLGITLPDAFIEIARATERWKVQLGGVAEFLQTIERFQIPGDPNSQIPAPMPAIPGVTTGIPASLFRYENLVSTPGLHGAPVPFWPGAAGSSTSVAGFSDRYGWNRVGGQLPGQVLSVFTGGGNVGGGLGAIAGGMGGQALGGMFSAMASSGFLSTGLATAFGAAGNVLPIVGPIVGAFLGKAIGNLFGPSRSAIADKEATGRIQTTQAGLLQRYGSLEEIAGMSKAGQELVAGWGHQGRAGEAAFKQQVAAFEASLKEQNRLLTEQERIEGRIATEEAKRAELADRLVVKHSEVQRIQSEYGITAAQLGGPLAQQDTTEASAKIINDLETLNRAAIQAGGSLDWGGTLTAMQEEINAVVDQSIAAKTALPENMRPFVEEMARAGLLTADLADIQWGARVETEAEKTTAAMAAIDTTIQGLRDALGEVVTALRDLLPAAARAGADAITDEMNRAGRTVRTTTGEMRDDFSATEEAATGAAWGHSPTGIKEITVTSKQAGEAVKDLGRISYDTFSTIEETAGYWARTQVAAFDKMGGMLSDFARQIEDLRATPEQRQALAIDRAFRDQQAALDPFKDDPRYTDAMAMLEQMTALKQQQAAADRATRADQGGTALNEKIARWREKAAQAMDLGRQLAFTQGQKMIGLAAVGSTLGVLAGSTQAQQDAAARGLVQALLDAQPRSLDGQPLTQPSPSFVMNVSTWNVDGMERAVKSDIWPRLIDMIRRNDSGALTQLRLALGAA